MLAWLLVLMFAPPSSLLPAHHPRDGKLNKMLEQNVVDGLLLEHSGVERRLFLSESQSDPLGRICCCTERWWWWCSDLLHCVVSSYHLQSFSGDTFLRFYLTAGVETRVANTSDRRPGTRRHHQPRIMSQVYLMKR